MEVEKNVIEDIDVVLAGDENGMSNGTTNGNGIIMPPSVDGMKVPSNMIDKKRFHHHKKIARQNSKEMTAATSNVGLIGAPNFVAPHRRWKNSRRSRNGHGRGLPKKGGAGGKGTWGAMGSELLEEYEDHEDPNYDSDNRNIEFKEIIPEITYEDFFKRLEPVILEYFENGYTTEVAAILDDILTGSMRRMVTKVIIEIAMEHKQSHREMASVLLSDCYGRIITSRDIVQGFDLLLDGLPELILDIPEAPVLLGNFIARAVADDCVPPKYVSHPEDLSEFNDHAITAIKRAETLLNMHHGWAHLDNVWGLGGGFRPVKTITKQMNMLLLEYKSSLDIEEAHRCILSLEVPHFYHELVYEAIVMTIEALNEPVEESICNLLKSLDQACIITPTMMEQVTLIYSFYFAYQL